MQDSAFERILEQISHSSQRSPDQLRSQMQLAMDAAMENPDPAVRAMWDSIPRQGEKPTLEEFMDYLVEKNLLMP